MPRMKLVGILAAALLLVSGNTAVMAAAGKPPAALTGDQILAQAASDRNLQSYSVPVHFDVNMHRPLGIKMGVDGVTYFKAPADSVLVITKTPLVASFFKGSYDIDLVPQTWAAKYRVNSVKTIQRNGARLYELDAVPRGGGQAEHVFFDVAQGSLEPVAAMWVYPDASRITVSIANQRVADHTLPQAESLSISMPRYNLDATGRYGDYSLNAPVPQSVFPKK